MNDQQKQEKQALVRQKLHYTHLLSEVAKQGHTPEEQAEYRAKFEAALKEINGKLDKAG